MLCLLFAVLAVLAGGCHASAVEPLGALAAADAASIPVFGRDLADIVVSGVSGRDCSIVHLDKGQPYCRPTEPAPGQPPFCTHSIGIVDCWLNPGALYGAPAGVSDGPWLLTPAQESNRTRRWPDL